MELNEFAAELLPHAPLLLRLARRVGAADADDLVQETFARALAARHRYRTGSNGRAWLCRILCNLAISDRRRRARDERLRARVVASTPEPEAEVPEPRAPLEEAALRAALAQLLPAERHILELAEIEDLSYREIARALDCPIGTVMSRLHRARRRLRLYAAPLRSPAPALLEQTESRRAAA
jgi:RNA polymerase sigma-70 factor (ECF subfamily)